MFIDTVGIDFEMNLGTPDLIDWGSKVCTSPEGRRKENYYKQVVIKGKDCFYPLWLDYYPIAYNKPETGMLVVTFSLIRVVYGNNYKLPEHLMDSIQIARESISSAREIPTIDIFEGNLCRIDPCYDHPVGDYIDDYITCLQHLSYPHRKFAPYQEQGVQYKSREETLKLYNKFLECGNQEAQGNLRQESTIRHRSHIKELLKGKTPSINAVTPDWINEILNRDLDRLGINGTRFMVRDEASQILIETYGYTTGNRLLGYLITRQTMTRDQIHKEYNRPLEYIRRDEKKLRDAGVAPSLVDCSVSLPPLTIKKVLNP